MYVIDKITDENNSLKKLLLIIYELLVNLLVINIPIILQMDKTCQKIIIHFILSIYLSVNIIYYRQNIIFNVVGVLTIAFTVILFQPYPYIFLFHRKNQATYMV